MARWDTVTADSSWKLAGQWQTRDTVSNKVRGENQHLMLSSDLYRHAPGTYTYEYVCVSTHIRVGCGNKKYKAERHYYF